jgi:hypothetical protein
VLRRRTITLRCALDKSLQALNSVDHFADLRRVVNHSHVVDNSRVNTGPIWWEVRPVLVMNQGDWPSADGSTGITSASAMDAGEAAGREIEVGSNFFLFFSSQVSSHVAHMQHTCHPAGTAEPHVSNDTPIVASDTLSVGPAIPRKRE